MKVTDTQTTSEKGHSTKLFDSHLGFNAIHLKWHLAENLGQANQGVRLSNAGFMNGGIYNYINFCNQYNSKF